MDAKLLGPFKVMIVVSPTALKLELPSQRQIHNSFHLSLIEPLSIASNAIGYSPDLNTIVIDKSELESNVKEYQYLTGYEVKEFMGTQFSKEQ